MTVKEIISNFYDIFAKLPELSLHCDFSINHASIYLVGVNDCCFIDFEENNENNIEKMQELFEWLNNATFENFEKLSLKYNN